VVPWFTKLLFFLGGGLEDGGKETKMEEQDNWEECRTMGAKGKNRGMGGRYRQWVKVGRGGEDRGRTERVRV